MEIVRIPLADLESNIGQIPDLPMNPRQWTKTDIDTLAKSLAETPELFEARPLLVVPHEGKFVILGGNLRYEGARQNKMADCPAIVFPEDTPIRKLKEIVIKDNGTFGAWDMDALANEWDDLPLADFGVPALDVKDLEDELPTDLDADGRQKDFVLKITFPDADKMTQFVIAYKDILEQDYGCTMSESGGAL